MYVAGQWLEEKYGTRSRRNWRKLHLAVDANSGEIIAHGLTDQNTDDPSQVEALLNQIDGEIGQFTADGAYDGKPTYQTILQHSSTANIVIPPGRRPCACREVFHTEAARSHQCPVRMDWTGLGRSLIIIQSSTPMRSRIRP